MMTREGQKHRYEMVNVQLGYVIVERDQSTSAMRAYFSAEPVPPKESYREGEHIWSYAGMAQSFQFDVLDSGTGEVIRFRELLGLMYYACAKPETTLHRIGHLAHDNKISIYVAITYEGPDGKRTEIGPEKLTILNKLWNERLRSPDKKILILPDWFELYRAMAYGEIMIDFGLTSMEEER